MLNKFSVLEMQTTLKGSGQLKAKQAITFEVLCH